MKKARDMSKLHENRETTMQEGKETMMKKKDIKKLCLVRWLSLLKVE